MNKINWIGIVAKLQAEMELCKQSIEQKHRVMEEEKLRAAGYGRTIQDLGSKLQKLSMDYHRSQESKQKYKKAAEKTQSIQNELKECKKQLKICLERLRLLQNVNSEIEKEKQENIFLKQEKIKLMEEIEMQKQEKQVLMNEKQDIAVQKTHTIRSVTNEMQRLRDIIQIYQSKLNFKKSHTNQFVNKREKKKICFCHFFFVFD